VHEVAYVAHVHGHLSRCVPLSRSTEEGDHGLGA
jgi:hypothetical protein